MLAVVAAVVPPLVPGSNEAEAGPAVPLLAVSGGSGGGGGGN